MRSRTAEEIYTNDNLHNVKSAGISLHAKVKLTEEIINWADKIFVMEQKHEIFLRNNFENLLKNKEIIILDICDLYVFMDPKLIEIIKKKVDPYLFGEL